MAYNVLPILSCLKVYNRETLKHDFIAGMTVALVLVPQSMAYAQLAGLPSYYGLYASFLPPLIASIFGSSRRLATGPVAVVSIMTAASLEPLAVSGSEAFIAYAILLAFIVGVFQFLLGIFRLGVIVNLLSHPVIVGFTNAAALIIASSQLSKFFGVHVDKAQHYYETMWRVIQAATDFIHWPTFGLGMLAIIVMITIRKWKPKAPNVLIAVALTTLISWATHFENNRYVAVVDIHVEGLQEIFTQLKSNLDHIMQASIARKSVAPAKIFFEKNRDELCGQCHSGLDVNLTELKDTTKIVNTPVAPENVLELHFMAGVLDKYVAGEKEHASELRKKIRSLQLVRIHDKTGKEIFQSVSSVDPKDRQDSIIWRINVGKNAIDPEHLLLVGGGEVIGFIPRGLPSLSMPHFDWNLIPSLLVSAIIISILGFMEAISIAKSIAARTGCRLDPNQELIGQGMANMIGAFGSSYPVSGSFSRSAVNYQAGAETGFSSVFTSILVVCALYFFTPLLYHLPQSVLAAIIMMAVVGLLNIKDIIHSWKVQRSDGIISVITFFATLVFAPHLDKGILLGVFLSIAVFFYRKMRPVIAELSLWEDNHFHSADRYHLKQCKYIVIIRFDGPLFFANISYLEDEVLKIVKTRKNLKIIHFKCNGINEIDASGETALRLLINRLHAAGYDVYFSGVKVQLIDMLKSVGLIDQIGEDHFFPTLAAALDVIWGKVHNIEEEKTCPLKRVLSQNDATEADN